MANAHLAGRLSPDDMLAIGELELTPLALARALGAQKDQRAQPVLVEAVVLAASVGAKLVDDFKDRTVQLRPSRMDPGNGRSHG